MVALRLAVILFFAGCVYGQGHGHNNHGGVPGPDEVDTAIVNIEMHYNDKLCLEILLVDCTKHVTVGDEQVCGSDGTTYANHCVFTHAMCEYLHFGGHQLHVANHGPCGATQASMTTTASMMTSDMATNAAGMTTTNAGPIVTNGSGMMTTTTDVPMTTTVAMKTTTTDAIHNIIANVFCANAASISCATGFEIICGTDGQLYPNQCELSKAKCNNDKLDVAPASTCTLPSLF